MTFKVYTENEIIDLLNERFEAGKAEDKKEIIDMFNSAKLEPQPLMVVNDIPTLRDKFAMAVLPEAYRAWITAGNGEKGVAAMAYNMADAMLEERNKRGEKQ